MMSWLDIAMLIFGGLMLVILTIAGYRMAADEDDWSPWRLR
jgi:hypothetical protein